MPDHRLHRESCHLKISSEKPIPLLSLACLPFTLADNAHAFMLDHKHFKVQAPPSPVPDQSATPPASHTSGDHLNPPTLAILALLASPLFLVGIPLAQLALSQAKQHPDQARAAKPLATIALAFSYLGILLIVLLAARHTPH
jgi:hypothetical protein